MFKVMTGVLNKNSRPSATDIQKIPSYIFCRWLSGSPHGIMAANQINKYDKIPIECQYNMIKTAFAGKIKYIPYPKKTNNQTLKTIEYLSDFFKISEQKAKEYMDFIDEKELSCIIEMYQQGN